MRHLVIQLACGIAGCKSSNKHCMAVVLSVTMSAESFCLYDCKLVQFGNFSYNLCQCIDFLFYL